MKALFLLPIFTLPLLFTGCEATVVDHYPRRTAYVERDVVVDRYPRRHGYVERDVVVDRRYPRRYGYVDNRDVVVTRPYYRRPATTAVVVKPAPYQPRVSVRYYNDARGRYYFKNGRRVYVSSGVHYY